MKKLLPLLAITLFGCPEEQKTIEACIEHCKPAHVVYFEADNHCACGEAVGTQVNQAQKDDED